MSTQRHSIQRQVIEITVGRATDAQRLQAEMSRIYRQRIVPLIEQYCTAFSAPDRIHRIPVLEIDVGVLNMRHLEETLVARFREQLQMLLADQIRAQDQHAARAGSAPKTTAQLELLSLFAQTGSLPWWADAGQPQLLEDALHYLLQHAPGPLARMLRALAHDSRSLRRLIQYYGDASLAALCGVLAPALRGAVAPLLTDLVAVFHTLELPTAGRPTQQRTSLWSTMLSLASLRGQEYHEDLSFYRELLPRLARVWQVAPTTLLAVLRQALQQRPTPGHAAREALLEHLAHAFPEPNDLANADGAVLTLPTLLARWQDVGGALASLAALLAPLIAWVHAHEYGLWLAALTPLETHAATGAAALREVPPGLSSLLQALLTTPHLPAAVVHSWFHMLHQHAATQPTGAVVQQLRQWVDAMRLEAAQPVEPSEEQRVDLHVSTNAESSAATSLPALLAQWQDAGGALASLAALLTPLVAWVSAHEYGPWLAVLEPLASQAAHGAPELQEVPHGLLTLLETLLTSQRLPPAVVRQWRHAVQQIAVTRPPVEVVQQLRQWLAEVLPDASLPLESLADRPVDLRFSAADAIYIDNAGLVILWPFLERFFERLGLVTAHGFQDETAVHRAVGLLQYLATADPSPPEYLLPLNKVLCGMAPDALWTLDPPLTEAEMEECTTLLNAVIAHAPILHDMSVQGLRGTFVLREGVLSTRDGAWLLRVQRETYDVVLDRFPWSVAWVKLSWMDTLMRVEW